MTNLSGMHPFSRQLFETLQSEFPDIVGTSFYRSPQRNLAVGGARRSQHLTGRAFDVNIPGHYTRDQLHRFYSRARELGASGAGYYGRSKGMHSAHIDTRPGEPVTWGWNRRSATTPDFLARAWARRPMAAPQTAATYQVAAQPPPPGNQAPVRAGGGATAQPRQAMLPTYAPESQLQGLLQQQQQQQQPQGGLPFQEPLQRFSRHIQGSLSNPLVHIGLGIAGGENIGSGALQGIQSYQKYISGQKTSAKEKAQAQQFAERMQFLRAKQAAQEEQFRQSHQLAQERLQALREKQQNAGSELSTIGVPVTTPDGSPGVAQLSRTGQAQLTRFPEGVRPLGPGGVSAAQSEGKLQGESRYRLPAIEQDARTLSSYIDAVLNHEAFDRMTNPAYQYLPTLRGSGIDFEQRVGQLKGKAFLTAFERLKGGGQITEAEGAKATQAIARLERIEVGSPYFRQALEDVRREVNALADIARRRAGGRAVGVGGAPAPTGPVRRFNPATGKLEDAR